MMICDKVIIIDDHPPENFADVLTMASLTLETAHLVINLEVGMW